MDDQKRKLDQIMGILKEKDDHVAVPIKGGEEVIIKGIDITGLRVHENGALIAITKAGQFYLIPTFDTTDEAFEDSPFSDLLKRISKESKVNVKNVADVDYSEHIITFINGNRMHVEEVYWDDFIKGYEGRLLH